MTENSELTRIRGIVEPIASDLDLDVYDIERRGVTVRVTLDTHPGSEGGITLDNLSLATRLISREIDHEDPISTRFTLEVTSPGLERQLRVPAHFRREVGKAITVRFRDPDADPRRIDGQLTAATESTATMLLDDGSEVTFDVDGVDKARTVFEWGPGPKPGAPKNQGTKQSAAGKKPGAKKPSASKQASAKRPARSNDTASNDTLDIDTDQDSDLGTSPDSSPATSKEKQTS